LTVAFLLEAASVPAARVWRDRARGAGREIFISAPLPVVPWAQCCRVVATRIEALAGRRLTERR